MCGTLSRFVGGKRSACKCMTLRTFTIFWLTIFTLVSLFELVAGSYLTSARQMVDMILEKLREIAFNAGTESVADYYYEVLQASFGTVWRAGTCLTVMRGLVDLGGAAVGIYGVWAKKSWALYTFLGFNVVHFAIDFILFIAAMSVVNTLYIGWFYPSAYLVVFALYGWLAIIGPYVSVVLLSYIWVVRVGGTGTEMKSFFELQEEQDKAATATAERSGAKDRDEEATARVEASEKKPLLENAEPTIEVDSP
ncbi:putative transmembrane protein [Toxoplasma gondii TgCatPRC2]|uniref:Putative transmembrane protein n=1 Tax=Toxoplasma gondii TgCatPRC2 TaxID=1130821 RepID=A0A151HG69_TOXGO|nr:putative transmembrane protein [Toxoplasma gondii TgCatPRC2]